MLLITGAAGFIGFHLARKRLELGDHVVGVDNLNEYYDVNLKRKRLSILKKYPNFLFKKLNISDRVLVPQLFNDFPIRRVVNLAAQAGVRYSIENPLAYIDANVLGFTNIIEGCRHNKIKHLVYASTSSVYGANEKQPFSESNGADHPLAIYAATKKCNELIAHSYSHLYALPTTGLRFFTVYGPWGRPDMALFLFAEAIMNDKPINVFNYGNMTRDFTYVGDIAEGISRVLDSPAQPDPGWDALNPDPSSSASPYRLYNIGNSNPVSLIRYINALETSLGKTAKKNMLPMQDGDVPSTYSDVKKLERDFGYKPSTTIEEGVAYFVEWYREHYSEEHNVVEVL
jgi:UDP-glucuronate 4-epimerase